jgi:hypothetical protein
MCASLIPKKPGDRVKTDRRDAVGLAKLSRAGELTAVWVPDERHEAMRDLSRAREAARKDIKGKRQQVSSFMLRLGRRYPGQKTWGPAHMNWLMLQKLEHREQRIALEELLGVVRQESERVERLEQAIRRRLGQSRQDSKSRTPHMDAARDRNRGGLRQPAHQLDAYEIRLAAASTIPVMIDTARKEYSSNSFRILMAMPSPT